MTNNPYRGTVKIWIVITLAAVIAIFLPGTVGIEGMSGGFAISFVSFFGAIVGLIVVFVYRGLASRYDAVVGGMEVLARWTYTAELWRSYADAEYQESVSEVKPLFMLTSAMCVLVGVGAFFWDPEAGIFVLGVMLATVVLMALAAFLTRRHLRHGNLSRPGEVIISKKAVLVNDNLFYWDFFGSKLESVKVRGGKDYSVLVFKTWAPTMTFGQDYSLRVPIPTGEEAKASEIASSLSPGAK